MSAKFVNVDRNTGYLLPPDLRDWIKDNDLAQFILEAVEATDLRSAAVNERGTGSPQYPPSMMLALLIYCYSTGVFSSRQIERASYDSISVRYLCANHHPDHDTIATFRRRNLELLEQCFMQVLELAGHMGLLKLGTLCIDGTKLKGNADASKNLTLSQIEEELKRLEQSVGKRLEQAELADRADSQATEGLLLPDEWGDASLRKAKLHEAKRKLEARLKRLEEQRKQTAKRSRRQDRKVGSGRKADPQKVQERQAKDRQKQRINPHDPDSHSMPQRKGGFVQGYNAQAGIDAEGAGLIVSSHVTNQPNDRQQLQANLERVQAKHLEQTENVVADSGYYKRSELLKWEREHALRMLVPPTHQNSKEKQRYAPDHPREREKHYKELLTRRLKTAQGRALYRKRNTIMEGCFATIKNVLGFKSFRLMGLEGAQIEWTLATMAYNCRKIAAARI